MEISGQYYALKFYHLRWSVRRFCVLDVKFMLNNRVWLSYTRLIAKNVRIFVCLISASKKTERMTLNQPTRTRYGISHGFQMIQPYPSPQTVPSINGTLPLAKYLAHVRHTRLVSFLCPLLQTVRMCCIIAWKA
jgi:hypothetical protein